MAVVVTDVAHLRIQGGGNVKGQRAKDRRKRRRKVATVFVRTENARTFCAHCGKQPVEWHHPEHPQNPNDRVSSLRTQGAGVDRIKQEMARCTPLCRSCHMKEDKRIGTLLANAPYKKGKTYVNPSPCGGCHKLTKPLRKGLCNDCYVKTLPLRPCSSCKRPIRLPRKGLCNGCYTRMKCYPKSAGVRSGND